MPPTNLSALTATDLGALPADVTQTNIHDSGTNYTVWHKFTAPAGAVVVSAWGFSGNIGSGYRPTIKPYTGSASSPSQILLIAAQNKPIQFPVTAGEVYFLEFVKNNNDSPAEVRVRVSVAPSSQPSIGDLVVNDDTPGFPVSIVSASTNHTVVKYVSSVVSGEGGDTLSTGQILLEDGSTNDLVLYSSAFGSELATIDFNATARIRTNRGEGIFYVGTDASPPVIRTITASGSFGADTWTLTTNTSLRGIAASNSGAILYFSQNAAASAIKRWDLDANSALSDLVAGDAGYHIIDILVLDDNTIVAMYQNLSTQDAYAKQFNSSGTLLNTYTIGTGATGFPDRLAYAWDDADAFWAFHHVSSSFGTSRFIKFRASTGATLVTRDQTEFEGGAYQGAETATPTGLFGHSQSCPLITVSSLSTVIAIPAGELVATGPSPLIVGPPPVEPPTVDPPTECPCPPVDAPGGGTTGPTGTGPYGGGGSGRSGTSEGGEGWTPGLCSTGGTVNTYAVAMQPSMAGVRDPRLWAEVAFVEFDVTNTETADTARWSLQVPLPDSPSATYPNLKEGRGLQMGRITRSLSDDNGNYTSQAVALKVNDKDRAALRTRLGSSTRKYVWEREVVVRITTETNRRTGYASAVRELFRGVTADIDLHAGFTGTVGLKDRLASQFGRFGPDRSFSSRLLTLGLYPSCPRELVGKPQQWIFGEVSDEGTLHPTTGEPAAKGLVPIWLVGALGGSDYYHLAAHDVCGVTVYGSDGQTPPARRLLTEGSDYTVQTTDLTDSETGLVHRVTHIICPEASIHSVAHKQGTLNMAANVGGVVGANGQLITDLFKIYQYIFEHIVLPEQESLTGVYVGSPQWADGRYMIHSTSFADAQTFSIARIGGSGYQGGFVLGGPGEGPVKLRDLLRWMSNSGDCWFVWTGAGQLRCVLLDDATAADSAPILTEPSALRELPAPRFAFDEVENPILYSYDYDTEKQKFRVAQASVEDATAVTRMGRPRPSPSPIPMRCVRDELTAQDVAGRRLMRRKYPPAYYQVVEPIDGLDREPGDVIKVTSIEGVGNGLSQSPLFVRETSFDPQTMRATHTCRDITDVLAFAAAWAPESTPDYASASATEREDYAFWSNDAGEVATDVAGKEWR